MEKCDKTIIKLIEKCDKTVIKLIEKCDNCKIEDLEKQITNLNNKNFELEEEKQQVLNDYQDLGKDLVYNFIPKSKIREKIEELENWKYDDDYMPNLQIQETIQLLQEILEDK